MFSLIISIISIALVAAIAVATIFFGGEQLRQGKAKADAARLVVQGQQLLGAAEVYAADHNGAYPPSLPVLVSEGYLKSIPTAQADDGLVTPAHAATLVWTMPVAGNPTFEITTGTSEETCREVNRQATGSNGIRKLAFPAYATQCFGESNATLKIVVTKDGQFLSAAGAAPASPLENQVASAAPSSDPASDQWFKTPATVVASGGSGGSGDGSGSGGSGPACNPTRQLSNIRLAFEATGWWYGDYVALSGVTASTGGVVTAVLLDHEETGYSGPYMNWHGDWGGSVAAPGYAHDRVDVTVSDTPPYTIDFSILATDEASGTDVVIGASTGSTGVIALDWCSTTPAPVY